MSEGARRGDDVGFGRVSEEDGCVGGCTVEVDVSAVCITEMEKGYVSFFAVH